MKSRLNHKLANLSLYIFLLLLAYMPFHILISTVIGVNVGGLELLKVLKDIVLVAGFLLTTVIYLQKYSLKTLFKEKIVWFIAFYGLLTLALPFFRPAELLAEVIGVVYNLRFLVFFVYGLMLSQLFSPKVLQKTALKIVLIAGVVVAVFGILQYLILPDSLFTALGYSKDHGVLPAFYIDDKPDFKRIMSTVRDPNSLGSYLIIISSLLLAAWFKVRSKSNKTKLMASLVASLLATFLAFSRSALLGTVVAFASFGAGYVLLGTKSVTKWLKVHRKITALTAIMLVVVLIGLFAARNSYVYKNVVLHSDEQTVIEDPNELRLIFWKDAVEAIKDNPAGSGPGTAGFSSIKNESQRVIFTENYYLQIGREVGVLGLLLFIIILGLVTKMLITAYWQTKNIIILGLLAAFAGLAISNMFAHIWFNETVAYTWWGLAGLYVITKKSKA